MAINSYATLTTAIGTWSERSYSPAQTDDFISLAEGEFNLIPGMRNYQRDVTGTIATVAGVGTLPTGFSGFKSVVYATGVYGPMQPASWDELATLSASGTAGIPRRYAVSGTQFKVAPIATASFTVTYGAVLTPLSASNTSNWLLALAPNAYLWMTLAQQRAFEEDFGTAQGFQAKAMDMLERVNILSDLAQYGKGGFATRGPTP